MDLTDSTGEISFLDIASSRRLQLHSGDLLISQGSVADSVYILVDGELEVSRELDQESTVLAVINDPGSVVGEIAAMAGGERTANVRATSPSEVVELTADAFHDHLRDNPDVADRLVTMAVRRAEEVELTEILAGHFDISDPETLAKTCQRVDWRRLNHGEVLFEEGDESDAVYIIVSGRLLATSIDSVAGSPAKIGVTGRGEVVGEIGLLGHRCPNRHRYSCP